MFSISSINGSGTGELLEAIVMNMEQEVAADESEIPKITIFTLDFYKSLSYGRLVFYNEAVQ